MFRIFARNAGQLIFPKSMGPAAQSFARHTVLAITAFKHAQNARPSSSGLSNRLFSVEYPERFQIKGLGGLSYEVVRAETIPVSPLSLDRLVFEVAEEISNDRGFEALSQMVGHEGEIVEMLFEKMENISDKFKSEISRSDSNLIRDHLHRFFAELKRWEYRDKKDDYTGLNKLLGASSQLLLDTLPFNETFLPVYLFTINNMLAVLQKQQSWGFKTYGFQDHLELTARTIKEIERRFNIILDEKIESSFQGPCFNVRDGRSSYTHNGVRHDFMSAEACEKSMQRQQDIMLKWFKEEYVGPAAFAIEKWGEYLGA